MTIALSANTPRVSYTVSQGATQTAFTVNFEFFDDADLNFYVDGTLKTLTTHYTVSGGSGSTGTINTTAGNTVTGASGGSTVIITRDIALARITDFPSSGAFEVATLNNELDRFTAIASDISDETTRSIQLADDDTAVSMVLPLKADRVGTVLGFNATTGAVEAGPTIANVNSLSAITANIVTVAGISSNVTTVAGISANVTTVAGISSNVTSVAGNAANINTVAGKASLITSDFASDMALIDSTFVGKINLVTSDFVTDMSVVTADFISDLNDLATTAIIADLDLLATSDFISDLNAVEGIKANVTTVAGISSNVTSVAGNATNINSAVSNASNINSAVSNASNINSAVGNASNINSVVSNASNINTVAGAITNVNNVGGSITNINTVASNLASVNNFGDVYRIASSAPSSSLTAGDLYFNTSTNVLNVYGDSGWQNAGSSVNGTSQRYHYDIGSAVTSVTGSDANSNTLAYDAGYVDVYVNGVRMSTADVTVTSGDTVTFAEALASGDEVDIVAYGTFAVASLNADNLDSGTVPTARVAGSYTGITGTGALNAGSITSGFGAIDNGASAITTTGVGTFGSLAVDNFTLNSTTLALSSGDMILDSTGDINLDSDSGYVLFKDGGTEHARIFQNNSGDVNIGSQISDKDMKFNGNDGGVGITALTLDMSDAGTAVFNNRIRAALASDGSPSYSFGDDTHTGMFSPANDIIGFSTGGTERMRIESGGVVRINNTANATFASQLNVQYTNALNCGLYLKVTNTSGGQSMIIFGNTNNDAVGSIQTNGSATSFVTSSDYRLKENVVTDWDATTRLKQLKPSRFNFIADADTTVDGFLAHEVSSIVPEAITGTKDAVYADGNPDYQGIDQSKLVPLLVKTIQELEARITALEGA